MLALASISLALAGPADDPTAILAGRAAREGATPVVLGGSDRSPLALARTLPEAPPQAIAELLGPELEVLGGAPSWARPVWWARPRGGLALGDLEAEGGGGDAEPGLLSARLGAEGRLYAGPWSATLWPEATLELGPAAAGLRLPEAWAGLDTDRWTVGFGLRDRWIGPGRQGSLTLTDHARAAPLGSLAWRSRSGARWGQARLEAGAGWLDGERGDVRNPGWLLMDARWAARPWLEIGGTRMAIFGGEGRPPPDPLQLLVPTEPHIYGDPEQLLPDQNEIAALDLRITIPVGRLMSARGREQPVDYLELWWQYGGEDVIARETLGVPYPSLAGVANLFGAELVAGPLGLSAEGARLLDDTFRWYTGHRIYHEGFTREGRAMGHPAGGDSVSAWGALSWLPGDWGAQLALERRRRVGVIEASGYNLFALATDELAHGLELSLWRRDGASWWRLGAELERVRGEDFVPGADAWRWRVSLTR